MAENPFTCINALCSHEKIDTSSYNPFMVNRFFSYFLDTILYANEANQFKYDLDKDMQFDYYYGLIGKKKRFPKWHKKKNKDNISLIAKHYDISYYEAEKISASVSDETLEEMRKNDAT